MLRNRQPSLPPLVFAQASPVSPAGSLFAGCGRRAEDIAGYCSGDDVVMSAARSLRDAGFRVLQVAPTTINIAAPALVFEHAFGIRLRAAERPVPTAGRERTATHVECSADEMPGLIPTTKTRLSRFVEGVAIEDKTYLSEPREPGHRHLDAPDGIAQGLRADAAHAEGVTGSGVHVAMVDSGWYAHPFFARHGVHPRQVIAGPGAGRPDHDEHGHGTGGSANLFAVAPGVDLSFVKMRRENKVAAFNTAVDLAPRLISGSWGAPRPTRESLTAIDLAMEAAVARAVSRGIAVVFAAGDGERGFPAQHPDVIAAGGMPPGRDGPLRDPVLARGFASQIYPGRVVPDVLGLAGREPPASDLVLPVPPGSVMDTAFAGNGLRNTGRALTGDGWAVFSGISVAAPQVAGVCALALEACPILTVEELCRVITVTSRSGPQSPEARGPGAHAETGASLIDGGEAVSATRELCAHPAPGEIG